MLKLTLAALAALSLSACATCSRHPTACSVAGAIVAGSVAATIMAHQGNGNPADPSHVAKHGGLCRAPGPC